MSVGLFCRETICRTAFWAAAAVLMVSACSALPASKPQSSGSPSPTEEGQATTEFHPAGLEETPMGTPPAGPIDDGYPVPDEILPTLEPLSKALAPGSSSFSMYLPGIWNERIPSYPFELQTTGVMAVQGFFGCNWIGVAGQVFDLSGAPLPNLVLHLEGTWAQQTVRQERLSGSATQYGPAGYEFILGNQTANSTRALWIQIRDAYDREISARIYFDTYNDCTRNLILINFNQIR